MTSNERGCDLLEKSHLCGIQNNPILPASAFVFVVICLKNRTFAVYKTTWSFRQDYNPWL